MQMTLNTRLSLFGRVAALGAATAATLIATGCSGGFSTSSAPVSVVGVNMHGSVHGGQQPVTGASLQLYAANQTGYGAAAFPLLTTAVTTDNSGSFSITGDYTCPSASSQVYLVATGGNSGSGTNAALSLMAALGSCGNLTAATYISMNELTTVGSVYALAPFMSSPTQMSTSATNVVGLTNGFAGVNKLVNFTSGSLTGTTLPAGATLPVAELNTLADIIASCVNSNGGSSCSTLFTAATPPNGTAPADTITALIDIAKNPSNNATALYNMVPAAAPFMPTLTTAPSDFTVAVKYAPVSTFSTPSAAAVAANGDLWVTNAGNNSISVLNATTGSSTVYTGGGLSGPSGLAFDASGNAWVTDKSSSALSVFTAAGAGSVALTTDLSLPTAVAIDGQGLIWVTNGGGSSVTVARASGTTVTSANSTNAGGINAPVAVAINTH